MKLLKPRIGVRCFSGIYVGVLPEAHRLLALQPQFTTRRPKMLPRQRISASTLNCQMPRDCRAKEQTRDEMRQAIRDFLYSDTTGLPTAYGEDEISAKTEVVFTHVYRAYP